jgi:succinoglycan biosynthesis protein ExoA
MTTDVTVIIPARNEEFFIAKCLESVLLQEDVLEVIVVDGASTDRTGEVVRGYAERDPRIRVLVNPLGSISRSLNMALEAATGKWLVRVDAHSTIPPTYVKRVVQHLRTDRWGGVGGRKEAVGVTPTGKAIAAAMGSRFGQGDSTYHYGTRSQPVEHIPFGSYPVELARKLGGWDERLPVNQDYEFDYRVRSAGHRLLFDPEIVIKWHCRQSLHDLFGQYRRYGRDKAASVKIHPDSIRPRHLAPPAVVLAWLGGCLVAPRRPRLGLGLIGSHLAAIAVATVATAPGLTLRSKVRLPGSFLTMHLGWGIGFWEGWAGRSAPASTAETGKARGVSPGKRTN